MEGSSERIVTRPLDDCPGFFAHSAPGLALISLFAVMLTACIGSGEGPDPGVEDFGIAYVKRPLSFDDDGEVVTASNRQLLGFSAGGDLYLRDRASPGAPERNITSSFTGGLGDVRDVEPSWDGTRLLFSMRAPEIEGADADEQPTWNIWEYDTRNRQLRRVISGDNTAEAGQDLMPHYLADGRIVFSSTRQRQSGQILLDEGKPLFAAQEESLNEPALVLHVMDADGSNIRQISFNQSHDLDPTVLQNGRIMFSRWDRMGSRNAIHLYTINPDGTDLQLLYGAHSHATGTEGATVDFVQPRELSNGKILATLAPQNRDSGGLVVIDADNYIDHDRPTWINTGILVSGGQEQGAGINVLTDNSPSPGGRFRTAFPLRDGTDRLLVSWSQCRVRVNDAIVPCSTERLAAQDVQEAPPLYGVYIYDRSGNTQLPVVVPQEGVMITDVAALRPRSVPLVIYDKQPGAGLDLTLHDEGVGIIHIRSVYDIDGVDTAVPDIASLANPALTLADQRPARFIRVEKAVAIPGDDVLEVPGTAFGRSRQQLMREIIGYAPVEPDGSVRIKVPADVPLAISVLDKNGRRIGARHQNWLQVRAGDTLACTGCHDHASGIPHGRREGPPTVHAGAPMTGQPFPNTDAGLWADMGESMAEARTRISCFSDCAALSPSMDVVYQDVWTDENIRPREAGFAYRYAELDVALVRPVSDACQTKWTRLCRIVINYETHIHPIWNLPRQDVSMNNVTCTQCHSDRDAMNAVQVPVAQLDLGDGPSSDQALHFKAYRELLFNDNEQELVGGALQDRLVSVPVLDENGVQAVDDNGQPVFEQVPVTVTPPMSTAGARASSRFFSRFDAGGSHEGWLSGAEMRLLAEWLDIGAQYYNNPFDVPQAN